MNCPICQSKLIFVEPGEYHYGKNKARMAYGKFYECERCGAEVVKRVGGKLRVERKPEPDMVSVFNRWDDMEYQLLMSEY